MNENENDDINDGFIEIKEEEINIDTLNINYNRNNSEDVVFNKRTISIFDINKITFNFIFK